jgi:hypothetical protein
MYKKVNMYASKATVKNYAYDVIIFGGGPSDKPSPKNRKEMLQSCVICIVDKWKVSQHCGFTLLYSHPYFDQTNQRLIDSDSQYNLN